MTLTEFARLTPSPNLTYEQQSKLLKTLVLALKYLSAASTKPFRIFASTAETTSKLPERIYLFGHWNSLEHHHKFLVSEENKFLLQALDGLLTVDMMFHIESDFAAIFLGSDRKSVGEEGQQLKLRRLWFSSEATVKDLGDKGVDGKSVLEKRHDVVEEGSGVEYLEIVMEGEGNVDLVAKSVRAWTDEAVDYYEALADAVRKEANN